jgi:glycosyltransferase involved in cell wall biosynthesis/SAM-dependent methyltransferase
VTGGPSAEPVGPLNVLHVIHFPVFGGPHNQALRLSAPLLARGFRTVVVIPSEPGNAGDRLRAGGVDVRTIPLGRLRATTDLQRHVRMLVGLPADVQRLRRLIRAERIAIVQVGGLVNPHAAIAARLEHVPVVWQLLDTRAPHLVAAAAMVFVRELADVVMSTGSAVAQAHPGYRGIAGRVVPFLPPVDLASFAPQPRLKAAVRAEWGLSTGDVVVGCVANINPQKGIVELVRAFAAARSRHMDAKLVLVGSEYATHAAYSAAVRRELAVHGLIEGRDIVFVGGRNDIARQLAGMDVVALAARPRSEGITTAILEAMAAGLPVVVTDVGALREAVEDGVTGFVTHAEDLAMFGNALARLLASLDRRAAMGGEARRTAIARFGIDACVETHLLAYRQALGVRGRAGREPPRPTPSDPQLPIPASTSVDGIRVYVRDPDRAAHDELGHDHVHPDRRKAEQAEYFGTVSEAEFEIERPRGTPRLYRFLLAEKSRRAAAPIRTRIVGASALTVCGGSGMDAEYLAKAGATVISSDLSLGAARRARSRAERHELPIESIVADVEELPFADESVDVVAVHDGLHHLDDPYAGLAEMVRVARRWVMVSEPARASITRLAVQLGLALETEAAGNRVGRLNLDDVVTYLERCGFVVLRAERYAMYYPHHPGAIFRLLSRPVIYPVVRFGWRLADRLIGRFGNKLVVVAERVR